MAATNEKARTHGSTQDFHAGWENATQAWRDMMGFQMRTAKTMFEQGMGFTRKATEHFVNQMEEGMKLQQDAIRYGLNLMDDVKKTTFDTAEKAFRHEGH